MRRTAVELSDDDNEEEVVQASDGVAQHLQLAHLWHDLAVCEWVGGASVRWQLVAAVMQLRDKEAK
eukprot:361022-Chlamydomonas_euryale.AAC.2